MKKAYIVFLALLLALMLTACSKPAAENAPSGAVAQKDNARTTLSVIICQYGPNTKEWFLGSGMNGTSFVHKFETENPDIKLNLEVVSWNDVHTIVDTRIANHQPPDILNTNAFANYVDEGLLLPASEYCPKELLGDFFPVFLDQCVINGECWGVPDLASARALFCNSEILQEVGVEAPKTWAELTDVCQAILDYYDGKIYPLGVDLTSDEGQATFACYAWGNGGGFVRDGAWAVNADENVEAVEYVIRLIKSGFTNPNPATQTRYDLQDMFAAGKLAMLIAPNQLPKYVQDRGGRISFEIADLPANDGEKASSVGVMDRLLVFRKDGVPDQQNRNEAIGRFLSFFFRQDNYIDWVRMEGFLPAVNSAVGTLAASDPSLAAWINVLNNCQFYPTSEKAWEEVKQGVITAEQRALTGADVRAELDALQAGLAG